MANKPMINTEKRPTYKEMETEEIRLKGAQFQLMAATVTVIAAILSIISNFRSPELTLIPLAIVVIFTLMLLATTLEKGSSNSSTIDWIKALNDLEKLRFWQETESILSSGNTVIDYLHYIL